MYTYKQKVMSGGWRSVSLGNPGIDFRPEGLEPWHHTFIVSFTSSEMELFKSLQNILPTDATLKNM
jgi:hypothetical protein